MNPRRGRARLRIALLPVLVAMLTAECSAALFSSPWLYVREIRVDGLGQMTPEEARRIRQVAGLRPEVNLFHAPRAAMRGALERLPFVAEATLSLRPPSTLLIHVMPRRTAAVLDVGGSRWEVDSNGVAIRRERPGWPFALARLERPSTVRAGERIETPDALAVMEVVALRDRISRAPLAKISVDQAADLCLNMNDGIAIRLGQTEELETKLGLVQRIYEEAPHIASEVQAIDLRSPETPACTPRKPGNDASKTTRPLSLFIQPTGSAVGRRMPQSATLHVPRPIPGSPD
jgi:cell division septal protein FtsQ